MKNQNFFSTYREWEHDVHRDPEITAANAPFSHPSDKKSVHRFLKISAYNRRFAKVFCQLSEPVIILIHDDVPITRKQKQIDAFRVRFLWPPLLAH